MNDYWRGRLESLEVIEPVDADRLCVFGLRCAGGDGLIYRTLDEALSDGSVGIGEVSDSGHVPHLKVDNKGDSLVFIMAGEHLVGAKQNRALNASVMVDAHAELVIDVSCVERGRWGYSSRCSRSSGTAAHSKLRSAVLRQSSRGYRSSGRPKSDQAAVWEEVGRKLHAVRSPSASDALMQAFERNASILEELERSARVPEDCCGAAFVIHGAIAGVELFDKPATLSKLWSKLVRSYAIDALEFPAAERAVDRGRVVDWLCCAAGAAVESFKSPGLGEDIRIEGHGVVGACLAVDGRPIHLEVFPENG